MNRYKFEIEDKFYQCATNDKWEINPITGVVRDIKTHRIIEPTIKENDYVRIGQRNTLHRLLAETFLVKNYPEGTKLHVHHIDENKQNNNLDNLMWLTPKEHMNLPEWKALQSKVQKGLQAGEKNPMYRYKWSDEQKRNKSEKMYKVYQDPDHKKRLMDGISKRGETWKNNISLSKKGKVLVYNDNESKFINKDELESYIAKGYKRGRRNKYNKHQR